MRKFAEKSGKLKLSVLVNRKFYDKYKKFCKENGLIIGKRIQDLMEADLEKRLIKIPEVKW